MARRSPMHQQLAILARSFAELHEGIVIIRAVHMPQVVRQLCFSIGSPVDVMRVVRDPQLKQYRTEIGFLHCYIACAESFVIIRAFGICNFNLSRIGPSSVPVLSALMHIIDVDCTALQADSWKLERSFVLLCCSSLESLTADLHRGCDILPTFG